MVVNVRKIDEELFENFETDTQAYIWNDEEGFDGDGVYAVEWYCVPHGITHVDYFEIWRSSEDGRLYCSYLKERGKSL